MIGFRRYELVDILGWVFDEEDRINGQIRNGICVDTGLHECVLSIKEKVIEHTLRAPKGQCRDDDLICVAFSAEERNFIMKKAKYYAELATRRKYDLGDGERISMIWRKLLHSNSPDVA